MCFLIHAYSSTQDNMAKGKDASKLYDAPEGHKITEYLEHDLDPKYRGNSNVKHLVSKSIQQYLGLFLQCQSL